MASKPITLTIKPRGKPIRTLPKEIPTSSNDTAAHLHTKIARLAGVDKFRLRLQTASGVVIANSDALVSTFPLADGDTITVKDLGAQISWRTVYILEYLGPLLLHPLIYLLRGQIYPRLPEALIGRVPVPMPPPSSIQTLSMVMITAHFLKRQLETVFVHRFSQATMPVPYMLRNVAYYAGLTGLNIALWTYAPSSPTQRRVFDLANPTANLPALVGVVMYLFAEAANFNAHLVLRNLRRAGTKERGIPHGFGFNWVTCPNYLFEMFAWLGIWLVNFSLSTGLYFVVATVWMSRWAMQREVKYRKQFPDKYKRKRYVMLPGIY